jgi:hypothetical protein
MGKHWTPRSSSIGNYFACTQRAAFDRAIHQGLITIEEIGLEEGCQDTKYADFGSLCHLAWQQKMNAIFHSPLPTDAEIQRMLAAAAPLTPDVAAAVEATASAAVAAMAPLAGGTAGWRAEVQLKPRKLPLTGHIDLYDMQRGILVDLKTTSRKPDHNRPKPAHLYQVCAYSLLLKAEGLKATKGYLLYVESVRARWAVLCEIDMTTPAWAEFESQMLSYLKFLKSATLFKLARPNIGAHCQNQFCPYVAACRDHYLPGPGIVTGDDSTRKTISHAMETTEL